MTQTTQTAQSKKTGAAAAKAAPQVDAKQVDEAVEVGKQTVERAVAATKEQVDKASSAALKGYDEFASVNKEQMDACVKSSNIVAKGVEDLSKAYFALAQSAAESNVAAAKKLMGAKTINDVFDIQSEMMKTNFDSFVAESTRLSEMSMKVANEAMAPLQSSFTTFVERVSKRTAV